MHKGFVKVKNERVRALVRRGQKVWQQLVADGVVEKLHKG